MQGFVVHNLLVNNTKKNYRRRDCAAQRKTVDLNYLRLESSIALRFEQRLYKMV